MYVYYFKTPGHLMWAATRRSLWMIITLPTTIPCLHNTPFLIRFGRVRSVNRVNATQYYRSGPDRTLTS